MSTQESSGRRWILRVVFVGWIVLVMGLLRGIGYLWKSGGRVNEAQAEVEKLAQEKRQLEEKVKTAGEETAVEQTIRDTLGMGKEGEVVVILPEESGDGVTRVVDAEGVREELPNWQKWMKLFFPGS